MSLGVLLEFVEVEFHLGGDYQPDRPIAPEKDGTQMEEKDYSMITKSGEFVQTMNKTGPNTDH